MALKKIWSNWYRNDGKQLLDLILVIPALFIFLPILVLVGILVYLKLGSPILFRQQRPGLNGQEFTILKFRTMTSARDAQGNLLPDDQRLTSFGKFLRNTSLDELPELINILRGEMSLVGPRPLLMEYLNLYSSEQMRRHQVRPGITGMAQIKGRNSLSWEEKFKLDVEYIDHCSLWLDLQILYITLSAVLQRKGISHQDHVTMPNFTGNKEAEKIFDELSVPHSEPETI